MVLPDRPDDAGATVEPDAIRTYLRTIASVPLLTREGELELARTIVQGETMALRAVLQSPRANRSPFRPNQRARWAGKSPAKGARGAVSSRNGGG